jgi:hypothetical protein
VACFLSSEQARLAVLDLPHPFLRVMIGRGRASFEHRVAKAGGIGGANPIFSTWPALARLLLGLSRLGPC